MASPFADCNRQKGTFENNREFESQASYELTLATGVYCVPDDVTNRELMLLFCVQKVVTKVVESKAT